MSGLFYYCLRFKQVLLGITSIIIKKFDLFSFSGSSAQFDSNDTATPRGTRALEPHKKLLLSRKRNTENDTELGGGRERFLLEAVKVVAMRPSPANTGTAASVRLINRTSCIIPFLSAFPPQKKTPAFIV